MREEIESGEPTRKLQARQGFAVASTTLALALSGATWAGCGDDETSSAATDATDAAKSDVTDATDAAKSDATDAASTDVTDATDAAKSDATDAATDATDEIKEDAGN